MLWVGARDQYGIYKKLHKCLLALALHLSDMISPMQLTQMESLETLLDNHTWSKQGIPEEFDSNSHSQAWKHPQVNVFVTLTLFVVMKVGTQEPNLSPVSGLEGKELKKQFDHPKLLKSPVLSSCPLPLSSLFCPKIRHLYFHSSDGAVPSPL